MKRLISLAALGSAMWFGFDSLHVRAGIFSVTRSRGVPLWIVLCYFAGLFAAGLFFRELERRRPLRSPVTPRTLAVEIAAFLAVLVAHYVWFADELVYAALTTAVLLTRLGRRREPGDVAAVLFICGIDLAVELSLIAAGRFAYTHTHYLPVPLWLSPMWACLGLSVRRFYRFGSADQYGMPYLSSAT